MFSLSDVLNFFAGPAIDRFDKGKLLAVTSGIAFLVVAGLFIFSTNDILNIWILIISIPIFNLMSRITYSIHNVIVLLIVEKNELTAANSILSMTNTGIDLLFNAVSGVLLVVVSLQGIFFINIPFLGVIFIIAAMNALGITNIIFGTIFQQLPPENMIGRVNTVNLSFMAVAALFGSFLGGMLSKISDCILPFTLCGVVYLLMAFFMKINNSVRRLPQMCELNEKII